ncbi:Hypothetical predicted protein [Mytilus galloprovincialis]|uniref:Tektin n=1 Tax=Mytilus galloprovincialis TaxID=29158 RepID=A0A8B6GIC9_MYTGA|nr:Hypothetical predicted protein [Mytilus galloprovincialis]
MYYDNKKGENDLPLNEKGLLSEVQEITETVESLQMKLRMAENALQELLRTKAALEQDLAIKNNSIFIDREKCLGMRKTFPMSPRIVSV